MSSTAVMYISRLGYNSGSNNELFGVFLSSPEVKKSVVASVSLLGPSLGYSSDIEHLDKVNFSMLNRY